MQAPQGFAQNLAHLQAAVTDPATENMIGGGGQKTKQIFEDYKNWTITTRIPKSFFKILWYCIYYL